jgi:glycosyltransferase involved in cell wall biosynthesis
MTNSPLISAVIPTHGRAALVLRAVRSALNQTYSNMEIIVVLDGPDRDTTVTLSGEQDRRLRMVTLPQAVGGASARNAGVASAHGEWIAFLDDDDEWLPNKIEQQLQAALRSKFQSPVVLSRFIVREPHRDSLMPLRSPGPGEHVSTYLFTRKWVVQSGRFATPVIFCRRSLLMEVPFRSDLSRHQDTDWYLRVFEVPAVGLEFLEEALAVVHMDHSWSRIAPKKDWMYSLKWIRSVRHHVTPRAYASFIAIQVADEAASQRAWSAFPTLLREMFESGAPGLTELGLYLSKWALSASLRRTVREHFGRRFKFSH